MSHPLEHPMSSLHEPRISQISRILPVAKFVKFVSFVVLQKSHPMLSTVHDWSFRWQ